MSLASKKSKSPSTASADAMDDYFDPTVMAIVGHDVVVHDKPQATMLLVPFEAPLDHPSVVLPKLVSAIRFVHSRHVGPEPMSVFAFKRAMNAFFFDSISDEDPYTYTRKPHCKLEHGGISVGTSSRPVEWLYVIDIENKLVNLYTTKQTEAKTDRGSALDCVLAGPFMPDIAFSVDPGPEGMDAMQIHAEAMKEMASFGWRLTDDSAVDKVLRENHPAFQAGSRERQRALSLLNDPVSHLVSF